MTVIGQDQPGLVEAISAAVDQHQGNWEESRMARLAGQFAGILKIEIEPSQLSCFKTALEALTAKGLNVHIVDQADSNTTLEAANTETGRRIKLELVGNDQEGIVHRISSTLAAHKINVESFESHCESAPWSGEKLFKATAELTAPPDMNTEALQSDLEKIAAALMVDFTLNQSL